MWLKTDTDELMCLSFSHITFADFLPRSVTLRQKLYRQEALLLEAFVPAIQSQTSHFPCFQM